MGLLLIFELKILVPYSFLGINAPLTIMWPYISTIPLHDPSCSCACGMLHRMRTCMMNSLPNPLMHIGIPFCIPCHQLHPLAVPTPWARVPCACGMVIASHTSHRSPRTRCCGHAPTTDTSGHQLIHPEPCLAMHCDLPPPFANLPASARIHMPGPECTPHAPPMVRM